MAGSKNYNKLKTANNDPSITRRKRFAQLMRTPKVGRVHNFKVAESLGAILISIGLFTRVSSFLLFFTMMRMVLEIPTVVNQLKPHVYPVNQRISRPSLVKRIVKPTVDHSGTFVNSVLEKVLP